MLLQGFNPDPKAGPYLPRRRLPAGLMSAWVIAAMVGGVVHLERSHKAEQEVLREVEIKDIPEPEAEPEPEQQEEEPEPEPEPEPDPEPEPEIEIEERPEDPPPAQQQDDGPPPPDVPVEMPTEAPSENGNAVKKEGSGNWDERAKAAREGRSGTGTGGGARKVVAKPKPKPKPRKKPKLDPTKAVELNKARGDKWPRAIRPAKPPYPEILRKKGITADISMRLKVSHTGKLAHAKILRVVIRGTDDPELKKKAKTYFLKSLSKVMKSWKFEPAVVNGQRQTVWLTMKIPFRLGG